jgi:hypothetical protein
LKTRAGKWQPEEDMVVETGLLLNQQWGAKQPAISKPMDRVFVRADC